MVTAVKDCITWVSRITYFSEAEGREVAKKLRENKIPSDVIHFDTGWFGTDWQCDYAFAADRFDNPQKMLSDLKEEGFHVSLWQLPYFTPKNKFFHGYRKSVHSHPVPVSEEKSPYYRLL